jgi:DNA modification methylase
VTSGWGWASVNVILFRKGKPVSPSRADMLDHITADPITHGRRAELPAAVCEWVIAPFAVTGGIFLDPFAGSGALCKAAEDAEMQAIGFDKSPATLGAPG